MFANLEGLRACLQPLLFPDHTPLPFPREAFCVDDGGVHHERADPQSPNGNVRIAIRVTTRLRLVIQDINMWGQVPESGGKSPQTEVVSSGRAATKRSESKVPPLAEPGSAAHVYVRQWHTRGLFRAMMGKPSICATVTFHSWFVRRNS